jgi:DNA-binding response OmpR family regulator
VKKMAKEARIFLTEDQPRIRELVKRFLSDNNHQVVVEAASLSEAEGKIECAAAEGVNIAIVDGDLGTGRTDGKKLSGLLRERIPGIKIIPFSFLKVDWGDAETTKGSDPDEILRIIKGWLAE